MKKILAVLLAVMLMVCGLSVQAFAEEAKNVIKYSIADDPQQMDPSLNS